MVDKYGSSSYSDTSSTDLDELLEEANNFIGSSVETSSDSEEMVLESDSDGKFELDDSAKELIKDIAQRMTNEILDIPEDGLEAYEQMTREMEEMEKEIMGQDENENKPIKWRVLNSDVISIKSKRAIIPIIDAMLSMNHGSDTFATYKQYVECIKKIPFGKYVANQITAESTPLDIANATNNFCKTIDKCLYGQKIAKNKLTQIIHNSFTNPSATPQVIGLQGPAGVGKTTLIRHGLAVAQNRPFFMYSLGGAKEGGQLEGYGMSIVGSTPGWVANCLMVGQCMNPVFFFDELDKVSETKEGREIINILMRLTDPTQNSAYYDKFLQGIELDLSKAIFIFSYNHRKKIDPILMDRITEIKMGGYTVSDKKTICHNFIIKEMGNLVGMKENDVIFNDQIIKYIINNFTGKEKGVRSLQAAIKEIFMKLNILRFKDIDPAVMGKSYIKDLEFPLELTKDIVSKLLCDINVKTSVPLPGMYL